MKRGWEEKCLFRQQVQMQRKDFYELGFESIYVSYRKYCANLCTGKLRAVYIFTDKCIYEILNFTKTSEDDSIQLQAFIHLFIFGCCLITW